MNDIYRDLQAAIAEMKTDATGIHDAFSNPAFDTFLGGKTEGKTAYISGSEDQLRVLGSSMIGLLGLLRAQDWIYRHAHWQVGSDGFYGDHLMFQRLYENTTLEIDGLAEKTAGYLGAQVLEPVLLLRVAMDWVSRWEQIECPFRRALQAEEDFQKAAQTVYDSLKTSGVMPLGLDDFIQALANSHDSHTYLLQQKLEFKESNIGRRAVEIKKQASSKVRTGSMRKVAFGDLTQFLRVGNDMLIHKCDRDLWKLTKDADGQDVIERLYEGDVLNY